MRVIAFDPGKNHFAYAVIAEQRCVRHGHVRTITNLNVKELADQLLQFRHDVDNVLARPGPDAWLGFERMQHRPRMGAGAVVEYMNLMIGVLVATAHRAGMHIYPVAPVTWKSHFIRQLGVERARFTMVGQKLTMKLPAGSKAKTRREFCAGVLDGQARVGNMTPHEGDAVGIGCYVWEQLTGIPIVKHVLD